MEAFETSSKHGTHATIKSRPERPTMLPMDLSAGDLD
jgi:hypothetical protein